MADFTGKSVPLTRHGIDGTAAHLGVNAAEVWTVLQVETRGFGFLPDRRPVILFERHIFHQQTNGRFDAVAPDVSAPTAGGYGTPGANQYARLAAAIALDREAALNSASWGLGQVMGFNAKTAGHADVESMVEAMTASEDQQLLAMASFIKTNHLDTALRAHDWTEFARRYNGPAFEKNKYHSKLEAAFAALSAGQQPDLTVRAAQAYLLFCGFKPGPVDGAMGPSTRSALRSFRQAEGLPDGDSIDANVLDRLKQRSGAG